MIPHTSDELRRPGLFITFEGIEGAGKSTQIQRAQRWLEARGHDTLVLREPGGTPLGDVIRELLLDRAQHEMRPLTELLLFSASRAQLVEALIRPALERGVMVLCDRFADSSMAYQGYGRGLPLETLSTLTRIATGGLEPALTFLLDLPLELGLARAAQRRGHSEGADRFEAEHAAFHGRVRAGFLTLAQQFPARFRIVDASRSSDEVADQIRDHLEHGLSTHHRT